MPFDRRRDVRREDGAEAEILEEPPDLREEEELLLRVPHGERHRDGDARQRGPAIQEECRSQFLRSSHHFLHVFDRRTLRERRSETPFGDDDVRRRFQKERLQRVLLPHRAQGVFLQDLVGLPRPFDVLRRPRHGLPVEVRGENRMPSDQSFERDNAGPAEWIENGDRRGVFPCFFPDEILAEIKEDLCELWRKEADRRIPDGFPDVALRVVLHVLCRDRPADPEIIPVTENRELAAQLGVEESFIVELDGFRRQALAPDVPAGHPLFLEGSLAVPEEICEVSRRKAEKPQAEDGLLSRSFEFREEERGKILETHDAVARDLAREENGPAEAGEEFLIERHGRLEREEIPEKPAGDEVW